MAFDARLILAGQQADPLGTARSLGDLLQQRQTMQMQQQTLGDLLRKREIYAQHADDQSGLASSLFRGGFGQEGLGFMEHQAQMGARQAEVRQREAAAKKAFEEQVRERANFIGGAFQGVKDQAGLDAARESLRQAGVSDGSLAQLPTEYTELTAPVIAQLGRLAVPAEKRAQLEHQEKQLTETERHNRAMEQRPSGFPALSIVTGEGGVQYLANTRDPSAPAKPIVDEAGKPIAKPTGGTKALNKGDMDRLEELRDQKDAFADLSGTFKTDYAGGGPAGTGQVAWNQTIGGLASKEGQAQAEWWANFAKYVDLPERNKTFGASLSAGEKSSWEQAKNIKPGNDPELIKRQLKKMEAILDAASKRRGRALAKGGYSLESIEEYTGPLGEEQKPAPKPSRRTSAPAGPVLMKDPSGETYEVDPSEVDEAIKRKWTRA